MSDITLHKRVHFIGIGGISMSALAEILLARGVEVSGSDAAPSNLTRRLQDHGATVSIGQDAGNIQSPDLVVYTAAIDPANPELVAARQKNIPTMERATFLGEFMKAYKKPISVSGTHGKTTTTSMLSCVLLHANMEPTVLVGGELPRIGGTFHIGNTDHLIFEGCEYVDSFLQFYPFGALILNVEADHLDYFRDIDHIKQSFNRFLKRLPADGFAVLNGDDENVMDCLDGVPCKQITFGEKGTYRPVDILFDANGCASFQVEKEGQIVGDIALSVPGRHNVWNALAVFATATELGVAPADITAGIQSFGGTKRRFEKKGTVNGATVYDDYAHHPTEITATLNAAQNVSHNKIYCVFQPHTYTRTKALMEEFATALSQADEVIITDIYAAREQNKVGVHASQLADKIQGARYMASFEDIAAFLKQRVTQGDIILTMGAGTITALGNLLLS